MMNAYSNLVQNEKLASIYIKHARIGASQPKWAWILHMKSKQNYYFKYIELNHSKLEKNACFFVCVRATMGEVN